MGQANIVKTIGVIDTRIPPRGTAFANLRTLFLRKTLSLSLILILRTMIVAKYIYDSYVKHINAPPSIYQSFSTYLPTNLLQALIRKQNRRR